MPKQIFFDANVIIDLASANSELNQTVTLLISRLLIRNEVLLCSPVSFAITYYFLSKGIKNNTVLNQKARDLFSLFTFTTEDSGTMETVMQSSFTDLEDALQYYAALEAGAEVILTKNYFDFYLSAIPVYHPVEYVQNFL